MHAFSKSSFGTMGRRTMVLAFCMALAVLGFTALPTNKAKAAVPAGITSADYRASDNTGVVTRMVVVIEGAELTTCDVADAELLTDWTYVANGLTGTSILSASCDTVTKTITFIITGGTTITGTASAPTLAYDNDDGDNSIANADGPMAIVTATEITDNMAPVLLGVTKSVVSNRNVLTFTYSEPMTISCSGGASTATCGDTSDAGTVAGFATFATPGNVTVTTGKNTVSGTGTSSIKVTLADQVGGFLAAASSVEPSGVVTDVSSAGTEVIEAAAGGKKINTAYNGAVVTLAAGPVWDLTKPTVTSVTLADAAGSNGRVDRATVVFSSQIRDSNITNADARLGGGSNAGTFTTGTADDATIRFDLTADTLAFDTSATAAQFTYSGATTAITDLAGNLVDTAVDGTIADADIVEADGANPVIVSTTPATDAQSVAVDADIVVTFSEAMNGPGTACTFSSSPNPTGFDLITDGANWSNGDKTVTLSHTGTYNQRTTVTITVGGCTAAAGPAALIANGSATVSNPWTFRTLSTGSGSGGGGGTVVVVPATLTVSIPASGATLTGGSTVGVTWTSANGAFVKYKVSYSADNGNNWTVLTDNATNTSYSWTVPQTSTTQGYIKVEGIDGVGVVLASDTNDAVFKINGTVAAPAPVEAPTTAPAPAVDPTIKGSYAAAEAKANNPSINDDKALVAPAGTALCVSGTLIKSSAAPAVYYCGKDGKRYVFVNDKAFFSWYADFSGVQTISADALAAITIGGNITYRPGTRMVKIQTDPKVYAVARGGVLRWVQTEAAAVRLFGADWNKQIDDVADSFFVNYTVGDSIAY